MTRIQLLKVVSSIIPYSIVVRLAKLAFIRRLLDSEKSDKQPYMLFGGLYSLFLYSNKPGERAIILDKYEPLITNLVFRLVQKDSIVFDIGSWIGYYAILAAAKDAKVYAVEMDPENVRRIKENIELNNFSSRVTVLNVAISSKKGHAVINPVDSEFKRRISMDGDKFGLGVPTDSLDNIVQERGVSRIDLLIMDIEGEEYHAVLGMKNLLKSKAIQHLIIELHRDIIEQKGHSYTDMIHLLEMNGYRWEFVGRSDEKLKPHIHAHLT